MNDPHPQDERIAGMTFASVIPFYLAKVEKENQNFCPIKKATNARM